MLGRLIAIVTHYARMEVVTRTLAMTNEELDKRMCLEYRALYDAFSVPTKSIPIRMVSPGRPCCSSNSNSGVALVMGIAIGSAL